MNALANIVMNEFVLNGGLVGWKWRTPINPEGDDVFAVCPICGEVMELGKPGMLICVCGVHLELGE